MQKSCIVADESFSINHARQRIDVPPLDTFNIEGADTRALLYICNCQSLLLTSLSQDVSDHEAPSLTFVIY